MTCQVPLISAIVRPVYRLDLKVFLVAFAERLEPAVGLQLRVDHEWPAATACDEQAVLCAVLIGWQTHQIPLAHHQRIREHLRDKTEEGDRGCETQDQSGARQNRQTARTNLSYTRSTNLDQIEGFVDRDAEALAVAVPIADQLLAEVGREGASVADAAGAQHDVADQVLERIRQTIRSRTWSATSC